MYSPRSKGRAGDEKKSNEGFSNWRNSGHMLQCYGEFNLYVAFISALNLNLVSFCHGTFDSHSYYAGTMWCHYVVPLSGTFGFHSHYAQRAMA